MDKKKTDRRVRRTKTRLTEGLLHLLMQKDIKDISVRELAEYADINRCTFYLHYKDIYDMIEKIEEELFQEFNEILDAADLSEDSLNPDPVLHNIFDCLYQNQTAVAAFLVRRILQKDQQIDLIIGNLRSHLLHTSKMSDQELMNL